ncbi:MAG: NAD(P)-dependent oxidoreductase [Terriglobales bacterium]
MKVLVLGATGSIGNHLVSQALEQGHEITALVRNPGKLALAHSRLRIVQGDALDPAAVDRAIAGQDAVIYSIGTRHLGKTALFSASTRILIAAMKQHGVRRLVAITGIGAGDSKGHGWWLYDWIFYPLITKRMYDDKDRQEELIRNSGLEWTIVRPAVFTKGPRTNRLRAETELQGVTIRFISRADTAAFVLEQLTSDRWLHKTPLVGY